MGFIKLQIALLWFSFLILIASDLDFVGNVIIIMEMILSLVLVWNFPRMVKEEGALLVIMGVLQCMKRVSPLI